MKRRKAKVRAVKRKAGGKISKMANSYANKKSPGNWIHSAAEVATVIAGGGLSAGLGGFGKGYVSIGLGLASIIGGNFIKDPTKLTSVLGASMIGYGVGKINEHQALSNNSSLQGLDGAKSKLGEGFSRFASELSTVFGVKKKDSSVGSLDLSILDEFDNLNEMEAIRFDGQRSDQDIANEIASALVEPAEDEYGIEGFEREEFSYAAFDDVDLTNI